MLTPEQRMRDVLEQPIPSEHVHRLMVEEVCGEGISGVCEMKYAAMRSELGDYAVAQWGAIKEHKWNLGKRFGREVDWEEGWKFWTRVENIGRGITESYASRFREIWELSLRPRENGNGNRQILTELGIYEVVIANPEIYEHSRAILKSLKKESGLRDSL